MKNKLESFATRVRKRERDRRRGLDVFVVDFAENIKNVMIRIGVSG